MTQNRYLASYLDELMNIKPKLGTYSIVNVICKGVINITTKQGQEK